MIESLFTTESQGSGSYRPSTLPMHASRFLAEIERLFGPRDHSFTFLGIDLVTTLGKQPCNWFPESGIASDDGDQYSKHIVIHLGPNALNDSNVAKWQLAHETAHLIDPWNSKVEGKQANNLEEGFATWYQNHSVPSVPVSSAAYEYALNLVTPLTSKLWKAIKQIRQEKKLRISEIPPDVLLSHLPEMNEHTAIELCRPFEQ